MNAKIKDFATQLAGVYEETKALKDQQDAILETAKEAGVSTRELRKVAREMAMTSDKLAKKLEAEQQLSLFRDEVGLFRLKGLEGLGFDGGAAR